MDTSTLWAMRGWDDIFEGLSGASPAVAVEEPEQRSGWFGRLRENLRRSSRAMAQGISQIAFDPQDAGVWERLEEALIFADVGVPATVEIIERARGRGGRGPAAPGPRS